MKKKPQRILLVGCAHGMSQILVNSLQKPLYVLGTQTPKLTNKVAKQDIIYRPVRISHNLFDQLAQQTFDTIIHTGFLCPSVHGNAQNVALFNIQLLHRLLRLAYGP